MNRRRTKGKRRPKRSTWSQRRIDNWHEEFRQKERANWSELVPEMAFVLLKCDGVRKRASIDLIAEEACATYPGAFETRFNGKKVPDYSLVLLTLDQAKRRTWGYAAGDWFKGWHLTRKGAAFARDVQRRRDARLQERLAA